MRALARSSVPLTIASLGLLSLAACSSDDPGSDAGAGADAGPGVDAQVNNTPRIAFDVAVVEGLGSSAIVGDFAQAVVGPSGRFSVAYGYVPPGGGEREIHYAELGADGAWSSELVIVPGEAIPGGDDLKGIGFDVVDGVPHVAFLGGDDDGRPTVEEPTDLVLATRGANGSWTTRTLVDVSTEATGDCSEYCNEGFVVGSQAALRATPDGSGFAVVYRDTHLGFARDDLGLADVEVYAEGGSLPRNAVVDPERGGGEHSNLAFTPGGDLVVAYNVASESAGNDVTGVWAAVYTGGEWRLRQVWDRQTSARVGVAASDEQMFVAFYDTGDSDLVVARSTDGGDTWTTERVDSAGKTGLFPSLALDPQGRPVVSYTYCGPSSDRDCPSTLGPEAKVRLAREFSDGWIFDDVDDGQGFGRVGLFTSVAVDADGKIGVAFVDDANGDLLFAEQEP